MRSNMINDMESDHLLTLDQPDFRYQHAGLVDMEAAGFYPTACRFTHPELVHSLKIVSDSATSPTEKINARQVALWVEGQQQSLERLIDALCIIRETK